MSDSMVYAAPPCTECRNQKCRCEFTTALRTSSSPFRCGDCQQAQAPQLAEFAFRRPPDGEWRVYAKTCLPCTQRGHR